METARGLFITLEGGEGSGKSSQVKTIVSALEQKGLSVLTTREPGGSAGGEEIRQLLVRGEPGRWDHKTEYLLMSAARCDNVARLVEPTLAAGVSVVCDRFFDSSLAYQGYGHGLSLNELKAIYGFLAGDLSPDLTLLFDVPVDIGLARAKARAGDEARFESLDISFHERVRQGYLDLARREPDRFRILDASQSLSSVTTAVEAVLVDFLAHREG
ncbi:MAG: dTMP kinase [Holosporales bacterium]